MSNRVPITAAIHLTTLEITFFTIFFFHFVFLPFLFSALNLYFSTSSISDTNAIQDILKLCSKLLVGIFSVQTLCQTGQQILLVNKVSEVRMKDPGLGIHLTSLSRCRGATWFTLRLFKDSLATSHGVVGVGDTLRLKERLTCFKGSLSITAFVLS